ncbi:hypothetical protein AMECASPLE_039331 [Ameca splendens]|uniref:Uncharacterized protein n=1 Tax=Ameca splendens TaxID=208324 RepID=A0ABV1AH25_9TELE
MLCVEVSLTISSRYLLTSRTSSCSFPPSEVTFHVPRASLSIRGSGLPRSPPSSATQSSLHRSLTVPPAGGGPTGGCPRVSPSGMARLGPTRNNPATRHSLTGHQAWLQGGTPVPPYRVTSHASFV